MDITSTTAPRSDQLNFDDVASISVVVTITDVKRGSDEQPVEVHLAEYPGRPFKPSKSMRRVLVAAWGADSSAYLGRRVELFGDPTVKFGKEQCGGVRIRALSDIPKPLTVALTVTRGKRAPFTVQPLAAAPKPSPTTSSLDSLTSAFAVAGIDKSEWLAYCIRVVGRELSSARDLTPAEIDQVVAVIADGMDEGDPS